jgi:hypothetical protein
MSDENKISIDLNISGDGKIKIEQYKSSFDSLRTSINGLSQPFNSFSNSINSLDKNLAKYSDSIKELNTQNKELTTTGDAIGKKVNDISGSFTTWAGVIEILQTAIKGGTIAIKGWTVALTGGLAIITTFLPEIIDFATALFKGKDAIDKAKLSLDSLNKGLSSTEYTKAIEGITGLQVKINLAKSGFASKSEVVKEYNETIGQTIGQVKTLDQVETSLKKNAGDYIKIMLYKASAMAAIKESAENQVLAQKELAKSDDESTSFWNSGLKNSDNPIIKKIYHESAEKSKKEAAKQFQEKAHATQVIAESFLKKASELEQKSPINQLKKQIENLKRSTDAGIIGSKTFKQLEKLKNDLKEIQLSDENKSTNHKSTFVVTNQTQQRLVSKNEIRHLNEQLNAHTLTLNKQLEQDKLHYNTEMTLLADQLQKKLISQEEFNKQSKQLQDTYHQNIGNNVEIFRKDKLDEMQKITQQIVDQNTELAAGKKKEEIKEDEKKAKDAILPRDIFNAEKKLIEDKYAYEIIQAKGNEEKIKTIKEKSQEDLNALTERYEQQRKEFALNAAQQVADKAFSIIGNNIKSSSDAKIKGLERDKEKELSNKSLTATQRKAIEDKYQKKENQEKVKAFKAEQKASVLQAVVNGALAITKATSQTGILAPFVIPGIIASTALQVATIVAQKPPAYAKGGHFVSDGRGAVLPGYSLTDNTNAYLRSGEAVVVSEAMRNPWARNLVSAINVAHGGRDFSVPNTGRGYAIGGIFTDGGNANRYYNQPVTDIKDMANTLAYQMINNFPPIYVDVKDVNNQQNILAQTVNRVNL